MSSSLDDLRDIHLPPDPAFAALDGGLLWGVAAGCLLLALGIRYGLWRRRQTVHLRRARRQLARLALNPPDAPALARALTQLLRGHAQRCYPDRPVAGLSGADWLAFLDETGGAGEFTHGIGAALATLPYRPTGTVDHGALLALARRWLDANPR